MLKGNREPLTQERLLQLLQYDPETGHFTRLVKAGNQKAGTRAGRKFSNNRGKFYVALSVMDGDYLAHRLAYFYMKGEWPEHQIDHRNGNGMDNRWKNLRPAEPYQNSANMKVTKRNRLGLKGVKKISKGSFAARICFKGKVTHIGSYKTAQEAHAAYCAVAQKLSGEFSRAA